MENFIFCAVLMALDFWTFLDFFPMSQIYKIFPSKEMTVEEIQKSK